MKHEEFRKHLFPPVLDRALEMLQFWIHLVWSGVLIFIQCRCFLLTYKLEGVRKFRYLASCSLTPGRTISPAVGVGVGSLSAGSRSGKSGALPKEVGEERVGGCSVSVGVSPPRFAS